MIGTKTGKVIGYGVRSKACRVCAQALKRQTSPRPHDCRKNWQGMLLIKNQNVYQYV